MSQTTNVNPASYSEDDTRAKFIDPALKAAGWEVVPGSDVRRNVPIALGRLLGSRGRRGPALFADYVLEHKGARLAVLEAKPWAKAYTEGLAQAKDYARRLGLRFAYSTNGRKIYAVDMLTGKEGDLKTYPRPDELWQTVFPETNPWREAFSAVPFSKKGGGWTWRYYQETAVTKALAAIAEGRTRLLLNLATGTGKTSIAFQIAWKLFQTRWTPTKDAQRRPRLLFLTDRNFLADQAFNDFSSFQAFEDEALVRISPQEIRKKGAPPKNGSVFFTIFQTFMSGRDDQGQPAPYFGAYSPDFFDCIIIDECHRGGANDESTWRAILEYFSPALQIGLTATPKRDVNADTYAYFGEPAYVYSLKEGINDGYLTPFKVRQFVSTIDEYTYDPDDEILEGQVSLGEHFQERDFNIKVEIRAREEFRVKQFLAEIRPEEKALVFCATQDHALLIRDLINQNKRHKDVDYCVRVTAADGEMGEHFLNLFRDNEKTIPTILTTSRKLSTGVDARNIRNIVLLRPVRSMVEFKQIVGRGTRLFDGKDYFTIYDFVRAYSHFQDPEWDGEPVAPEPPGIPEPQPEGPGLPLARPEDGPDNPEGPEGPPNPPHRQMLRLKLAAGKERTFECLKATSFWGPDGAPISAQEFLKRLYGDLPTLLADEDQLRAIWSRPDTRCQLLVGLAEKGFPLELLLELQRAIDADNSDLYDVLAFIAFEAPLALRTDRAAQAKTSYPADATEAQKAFLDFILSQYVSVGFSELDSEKLDDLLKILYGESLSDALNALGRPENIRNLFLDVQRWLYE